MIVFAVGTICFALGGIVLLGGYALARKEWRDMEKFHGYMNVNGRFLYIDYIKGSWYWYIRHYPSRDFSNARMVAACGEGFDTHKEALEDGQKVLARYIEED